jgi:hypothetical protein
VSDWHLESLPEEVRAEAEKTAQRAGMPLHRWLGRVIRDTSIGEGFEPPAEIVRTKGFDSARAVLAAANTNSASNVRVDSSPSPPSPPQPVTAAEAPALVLVAPRQAEVVIAPRQAEVAASTVATSSSPPVLRAVPVTPPATPPAQSPQPAPPASGLGQTSPSPVSAPPAAAPATPRPARAQRPAPPAAAPVSGEERQSALVELVQALELGGMSPVAEARAYLRLMTVQRVGLAQLSDATGKSRDDVVGAMRLLGLPEGVRDLIDSGKVSRDQAFSLLDAADPEAAASAMARDHAGASAP